MVQEPVTIKCPKWFLIQVASLQEITYRKRREKESLPYELLMAIVARLMFSAERNARVQYEK